jgi:hypothetical protein
MKKTILSSLLAFSILQLAVAAPAVKEFTSKEGGFSVMTPVAMEEASQDVDTQIGKIRIVMYGGELDGAAFQVGFNDYPKGFVTPDNTTQLLDGAREGMVNNIGGTLVSEQKVFLKGYAGREIVATVVLDETTGEAIVKARIYMVGSRLYQIVVVSPAGEGAVSAESIDAFLKSFKLL